MIRSELFLTFCRALLLCGLCESEAWAGWEGVPVVPPNDNWAEATEVSGSDLELESDLALATAEAFESIPQDQFGHTVWWRWTAPADGLYEWDTAGSAGPVAVNVWAADALGQLVARSSSLRRLVSSNPAGLYGQADGRGSFSARRGEAFWISADAAFPFSVGLLLPEPPDPFLNGAAYGIQISLRRSTAPALPNDHFANRILLSGTNATARFRLDTTTAEDGEPSLPGESLHRTAWWSWQAPGNGTARIRSVGTNGAPVVGVYQMGPLFELQRRATSATQFGNECYREWRGRDVVEWDVAGGTRYEIQADRYPWNLPETEYQLDLDFTPAPANDNLTGAQLLEGNDLHLVVNNFGASRQADDPLLPDRNGDGSVWFRWTAPGPGNLQVTTNEPLHFAEPTFEILPPGGTWQGSVSLQFNLNPCVGAFGDVDPPQPFLPVFGIHRVQGAQEGRLILSLTGYGTNTAVADVEGEVRLQLDGVGDASGETAMNLLFTPPPVNDRFATRIVLPTASVKVGGRTFGARPIFGSPVSGRTVWWQWSAPVGGLWVLRPKTDVPHHLTWLQRGADPRPNTPALSTAWPPLLFMAEAGEVFQIAVVATEGFGDNVSFQLEAAIAPPLILERRMEFRNQAWTPMDTLEWPNGYDLPRVVESSTDLDHWTELRSLDDWRFATPVNQGELQRFYRARLAAQ